MKTIWINNPFDFIPGEGAKLQRYALLSQALAKAGFDVLWWSSDWNHIRKARRFVPSDELTARELGLECERGRVRVRLVHTLPYSENISLARIRSHRAYAREWARLARRCVDGRYFPKPDCILASTPPLSLFGAARKLARRWRIPLALDVQDLWPQTFYQVLPKYLRRFAPAIFWPFAHIARTAYKNADLLTVVAPDYLGITGRADAICFPHSVKLPRIAPDYSWPGTGYGAFKVCYVGNLGAAYRLGVCIGAVGLLARQGIPIEFSVAGDGPQRGLVEDAAKRGLPVNCLGVLDSRSLNALLESSVAGIIPMVSATAVGIPNKLCDYSAHGLAIASSLGGSSHDLIAKYGAGVFYPADDPAALADSLKALWRDPARLAAMRTASRRMAVENFDAAKTYPAFAERIAALCSS